MTKARPKPRDPWDMIDPKFRPTPERRRFGDIRPIEFSEKGEGRLKGVVAFDKAATPVALATGKGWLTPAQKDAADRLEGIAEIMHLCGGSRDSTDMAVRGGGDMSDSQAIRLQNARDEFQRARRSMSSAQWRNVVGVVVHHWAFGSRKGKRFVECASGLARLAALWRITG